jgi:hypothetical protein
MRAGRRMLRSCRTKWEDKARTFKKAPDHNCASHGADAWRYLSLSWRAPMRDPEAEKVPTSAASCRSGPRRRRCTCADRGRARGYPGDRRAAAQGKSLRAIADAVRAKGVKITHEASKTSCGRAPHNWPRPSATARPAGSARASELPGAIMTETFSHNPEKHFTGPASTVRPCSAGTDPAPHRFR